MTTDSAIENAVRVVKPPRLRMYVYCSTDTFERLCLIGSRWTRCIAAQQSNLVREAEQLANDAQRRAPSDYMKHRTNWECANQDDALRLRTLVEAWPRLTRRQQEDLVCEFDSVVGAA
jgi:hypothetical protein